MAKDKNKTEDYFYSGKVLRTNRVSTITFCGVWTANKDGPFPEVIESIKLFESEAHGGADVTLTAFNKLG